MIKEKFEVGGMTCAACQSHVDKAVRSLNGVKECNVNLLQNNMVVEYDERALSAEQIEKAVSDAGYKAYKKGGNETQKPQTGSELKTKLKNLIISIVFLVVLMYFSMGSMMWGWPVPKVFDHHHNPMGFALIQFLLVLPICFINRNYYISGFKKLFKLAPNMDTLIAVGSLMSMIYGVFALFMISSGKTEYSMYLYFESAGMILVFVSIGKYLEGLSKSKTTDSLTKLIDLSPKTANVIRENEEKKVKVEEVAVGDVVILRKGDNVPVDGRLIEGSVSVDQANITGESMPVLKRVGENVYSSTIVMSGYAKVEAVKVGNDTSFSTIIKLVEEASNSKAPISKLADKVSGIFVPTILILATITFIVNLIYVKVAEPSYVLNAFENALNFAITTIVIACPCALGLATPVAIMVGTGKGAENGLLIKNAEILEEAHRIKTVVFDKTGTITKGKPEVVEYKEYKADSNAKNVVFSMEKRSNHPLSNAITSYLKDSTDLDIESYVFEEGKGLSCVYKTDLYKIGNSEYVKNDEVRRMMEEYSKTGSTPLVVLKNDEIISIFVVKDEIKETSKKAVELLKAEGIKTVMLTGDNGVTANAVKVQVEVDEVISDVLPSEKAEYVKEIMKKTGGVVAMVGDGVNDAPALKTASLGVAIGAGSDVAIDAADIVLLKNELIDVVNAIKLSKRTISTIKLGLFWAFFYNSICVVLATGLFYYISKGSFKMVPMYGAIAMSVSSVSVVLNALTINFFKPIKSTNNKQIEEVVTMNQMTVKVEGMMCAHCKAHVEEACKKVAGVTGATASLENKNVVVEYSGDVDKASIVNAIVAAGYNAE